MPQKSKKQNQKSKNEIETKIKTKNTLATSTIVHAHHFFSQQAHKNLAKKRCPKFRQSKRSTPAPNFVIFLLLLLFSVSLVDSSLLACFRPLISSAAAFFLSLFFLFLFGFNNHKTDWHVFVFFRLFLIFGLALRFFCLFVFSLVVRGNRSRIASSRACFSFVVVFFVKATVVVSSLVAPGVALVLLCLPIYFVGNQS